MPEPAGQPADRAGRPPQFVVLHGSHQLTHRHRVSGCVSHRTSRVAMRDERALRTDTINRNSREYLRSEPVLIVALIPHWNTNCRFPQPLGTNHPPSRPLTSTLKPTYMSAKTIILFSPMCFRSDQSCGATQGGRSGRETGNTCVAYWRGRDEAAPLQLSLSSQRIPIGGKALIPRRNWMVNRWKGTRWCCRPSVLVKTNGTRDDLA